ncbi:MAG: lactate racemase domain-containing protein [Enterocloster sp.]
MLKDFKDQSIVSKERPLEQREIELVLDQMIGRLPEAGRILIVPPDITRCCSYGGVIAAFLYKRLSEHADVYIMPAVGTHRAMTRKEQKEFLSEEIPEEAFLYHDWRKDTVKLGMVPAEFCSSVSDGKYNRTIDVEVDSRLTDGSFDLILSIGQVVPHEVVGMSNYSKNILVGLGGRQMINESHMLGAVCDLEKIMGRRDTPVRAVFDYAEEHFLKDIPLVYILTVTSQKKGKTAVHGVFTGASRKVYEEAAALASLKNITYLQKRVRKAVAYLDPEEFSSAWVGNKAIYRTRMIIEDGGELLVIAPGLKTFGENTEADSLIRRYGYRGTEYTMDLVEKGKFQGMEMAAAHMIHSSSEGRFRITYAVNPHYLSREQIEAVGYEFMDVSEALSKYPADLLEDGYQRTKDGEEIYVIKSPALGVWKTSEEDLT